MTDRDRLVRDLVTLRRGSPAWRKVYARYRRTAHWKELSAAKLKLRPFCEMCPRTAKQVHHRVYSFFSENVDKDLVSVCSTCHKNHHRK